MNYAKKPIYADFLVTPICNFKCSFCSACATEKNGKIKELNLQTIEKVFKDFDKLEMLRISIEGGEPFLRDDIIEIIQMADKCDFEYYVNTNGSMIDRNMAKRLGKTNIQQICISIDGPNAEIHDYCRGFKGSFDKVVSAINYLHEQGIYVRPIITLTKLNLSYFYSTLNTIKKLGANSATVMLLAIVGNANSSNNLHIEYDEWSDFLYKLSIDKLEGNLPIDLKIVPTGEAKCPWELYLPLKDRNRLDLLDQWIPKNAVSPIVDDEFGCTAAKENFAIDGFGNVFGCSLMVSIKELAAGNIKENSIIDIWNNSNTFNNLRNLKLNQIEGNCKNCNLLNKCNGGCRACAYTATGKIIGSDLRCPNTRR